MSNSHLLLSFPLLVEVTSDGHLILPVVNSVILWTDKSFQNWKYPNGSHVHVSIVKACENYCSLKMLSFLMLTYGIYSIVILVPKCRNSKIFLYY